MAATIHLMHGFIGFGKTTVAKRLAQDLPAVRLTNDEFMKKLYGRNPTVELFKEYYDRIDGLIWDLTSQIIKAGANVIIDSGFWSKEARTTSFNRAKEITENVVFHKIECDMEIAKKRALRRTDSNNTGLYIDATAFEALRKGFEPMDNSEEYKITIHR
jgi:predicted kinase